MDGTMNRRDFVKASVGTAAATAAFGAAAGVAPAAGESAPESSGSIPTVKLPRWGGEMPILGFGSALFIPAYTKLPKEEQIDVIKHACARGIRYFDTAYWYQTEGVVGAGVKDVRDKVYINTKTTYPADPSLCAKQIEESLKNLQTDYLDCVKVHCPYDYDYGMRVADIIEKFRNQGKVKNIGFSDHIYFEQAYKLIDSGRFDEVLIARGYFPTSDREIISQRNEEFRDMAVARAHELGMNVLGMKALGGMVFGRPGRKLVPDYPEDKMKRMPGAAIRWAYSDKRFHFYVIGMALKEEIDDNINTVQGDMTLTNDDQFMLAEFSTKAWASETLSKRPEPSTRADSPRYIPDGLRRTLQAAGRLPADAS